MGQLVFTRIMGSWYDRDKTMNFRSVADLNKCIRDNLHKIPRDVDLVVGIPRCGMLPATIIALTLHVALTDLFGFLGFLEGRIFRTMRARAEFGKRQLPLDNFTHILIVDDSVDTGVAKKETRAAIEGAGNISRIRISYLAVYCTSLGRRAVDIYLERVSMPHLFEWNFMHHGELARCDADLDGVLCCDPTERENDDGERYIRFLKSVQPRLLPTMPIRTLVTSRLEKYRKETAEWLSRHNVSYQQLIMLNLPSKEARFKPGVHAKHKAEFYRRSSSLLFIESHHLQATEISRLSGKPVLSIEKMEIVNPSFVSPLTIAQTGRSFGQKLGERLATAFKHPQVIPMKIVDLIKRKGWGRND